MTNFSNNTLVLIDGSSYLYRAYHALPPLTNSQGEPTGAVYGFVNMLRKLLKDHPSSHVAVIFDPKGKTFRDDLYPQYKANRDAMPDALVAQVEPIFNLVRAMGLPLYVIDGFEADDVIGTLATHASAHGWQTLISTGDKDLAQLVDPQVTLVNTMTGSVLDEQGVVDKFGFMPDKMIDYLSLVGDSVDNIPGVPGIGPKTGVKLLTEYGSLDNLIAKADEIKGKVGENLRGQLSMLPLMRELVTIRCDVPLNFEPEDIHLKTPDHEALLNLFKRYEFKNWIAELQGGEPKNEIRANYQIILDMPSLKEWIEKLKNAEVFAIDTETTSLDYMQAQLVGLSFAINAHEAAYVPVAHDYLGAPNQLSRDEVLSEIKPLLESEVPQKIGHNIKYDMSVFQNHGIALKGIAYDTMLEAFVFSSVGRVNMDALALKYLNYTTVSFEEIAGKGAKQLSFNQIPIDTAGFYAAEDADITLRLHQILWPKIHAEEGLHRVFCEIEMPLVPILSQMERTGVLINPELLREQSKELAHRIGELEEEAYKIAGCMFNLSSPKQLQEILYDKMKIPVFEKTATGQPSTAESVLQELALQYDLPKVILEHRTLAKLKSTYTDKLVEQIDFKTGRVHTSYHQAGAATGRFSSTDPNLQNIPARTQEGHRIRQAFIAPSGYKMVAADYSQIELRIMAHISRDEGLLSAFQHNRDIHQATAAEIFGIPHNEVTPEQRRHAKVINFGLIYGMSAFGLARQLGIERHEAQEYIARYFARYPGVKHYMEATRAHAHEKGYVETLFGRRLYLPDINTSNMARQRAAERTAINAPMQGTAADIIKRAMIDVANMMKLEKFDARMIMQVHDELVFEVAEKEVQIFCEKVQTVMGNAAVLDVPLLANVGVGSNWDEAH